MDEYQFASVDARPREDKFDDLVRLAKRLGIEPTEHNQGLSSVLFMLADGRSLDPMEIFNAFLDRLDAHAQSFPR